MFRKGISFLFGLILGTAVLYSVYQAVQPDVTQFPHVPAAGSAAGTPHPVAGAVLAEHQYAALAGAAVIAVPPSYPVSPVGVDTLAP